MSDDWFDRSYRSGESPPPELDARILAAARRATRRWTWPVIAAGILVTAALAILGFLVTEHEQYVPPATGTDYTVPVEGTAVDTDIPPAGKDTTTFELDPDLQGHPAMPPKVVLPDPRTEILLDARTAAGSFPELPCEEPGPNSAANGGERRDQSKPCIDKIELYIEADPSRESSCPPEPEP